MCEFIKLSYHTNTTSIINESLHEDRLHKQIGKMMKKNSKQGSLMVDHNAGAEAIWH